jgi:hypothetical protein
MATATKAPPRPSKNHDQDPRVTRRLKWREQLAAAEAAANEELAAAIAEASEAELPLRERGRIEFLDGQERYRRALAVGKVDAAALKLELCGKKYREALLNDLTVLEREEIWAFRREFSQRRDRLNATGMIPEEAARACSALHSLKFKTPDEQEIIKGNARAALEALERQRSVSQAICEILQRANDGPEQLELAADFRASMRELRSRVLEAEAAEYHVTIA